MTLRRRTVITVFAWIAYALVALRLFSQALNTLSIRGNSSDLHVYVVAAHTVLTRNSIYDYANPVGNPFTYPPFAALVITPTAVVGERALRIIWIAALILGTAFLARLLVPYVAGWFHADKSTHRPSRFSYVLPLSMIFVSLSVPSMSGLTNGQISLFIILLTIVDCIRFLPGRYGGVLTGIAAAIKLTPLIFVPYFWIIGRRRAAVTSLVTFLVCTGLAYAVRPVDSSRYWFSELWKFDRVGVAWNPGNESVEGLLARLGMAGQSLTWTWLALAIAIAVLGLWRGSRAAYAGHALLGAAIVGAASVCVSPVSWGHHCYWLIIAIIGTPTARRRWRLLWPLMVAVIMLELQPYVLTTVFYDLLPLRILALVVGALGLFAVAVACLVPFHEIRRIDRDAPSAGGRERGSGAKNSLVAPLTEG